MCVLGRRVSACALAIVEQVSDKPMMSCEFQREQCMATASCLPSHLATTLRQFHATPENGRMQRGGANGSIPSNPKLQNRLLVLKQCRLLMHNMNDMWNLVFGLGTSGLTDADACDSYRRAPSS